MLSTEGDVRQAARSDRNVHLTARIGNVIAENTSVQSAHSIDAQGSSRFMNQSRFLLEVIANAEGFARLQSGRVRVAGLAEHDT